MKRFVVDFESYYSKKDEVSASTIGNTNYVTASYAYLVSIVGDGVKFVGSPAEARAEFKPEWWSDPEHIYFAANSNFDEAWADKEFPPTAYHWKCILDRGAPLQLPQNLAGLSLALTGEVVDKSLRDFMDGKHWSEIGPEKQKEVRDYCLQDSVKELELLNKLPEPSPLEDALAEHTRRINRTGIHIDVDRMEGDKTRLAEYRHRAFLGIPWRNDAKPLSMQALARYCESKGLPVPKSRAKTDEDTTELMDAHPGLADVIGAMRRFTQSNTMIRKIESVQARVTPAGTIPLELIYCGARHTRRWSCRGVNIQNLDREPIFISPEAKAAYEAAKHARAADPLAGLEDRFVWSRHWLIPPPGKLFLSLDYAQIEPRCLHWVVGNEPLLQLIRAGFSVYEAHARMAKGWKGSAGTLKKEIDVKAYTRIKNEFLGLGYGMGAPKYSEYADVDLPEAKATVLSFRRAYPKVQQLWNRFDEDIRRAALAKEDLGVQMETGEYLRHFGVRATLRRGYESWTIKSDYTHGSHQPRLWGGTLTENVVQRMARDVLGEGILRLERAGFVIAFSAHDELVLVIDRDNKEDAKREAMRLMSIAPDWAPGLPLGVEGDFSERYSK